MYIYFFHILTKKDKNEVKKKNKQEKHLFPKAGRQLYLLL